MLGYGLILVLGFLDALSMFFRSLLYPFPILCRFFHHNIPPKGWGAFVANSLMRDFVVWILAGAFHDFSSY
jgi:hypothetical protein